MQLVAENKLADDAPMAACADGRAHRSALIERAREPTAVFGRQSSGGRGRGRRFRCRLVDGAAHNAAHQNDATRPASVNAGKQ